MKCKLVVYESKTLVTALDRFLTSAVGTFFHFAATVPGLG